MKRVIAKTAVAVAGAATIALLAQPGLANAKLSNDPHQIPSDAMVIYKMPFDHNLGVAAQNTGIPQALNRADLSIPVPGATDALNVAAWALNRATYSAAQKPGKCVYFGALLGPDNLYFATLNCDGTADIDPPRTR